MKLSKTQRRLASKLLFPVLALCMMTSAMALARVTAGGDEVAHVASTPSPSP